MDTAFISEFINGKRVICYIGSENQFSNIKSLEVDPLEKSLYQAIVVEKL